MRGVVWLLLLTLLQVSLQADLAMDHNAVQVVFCSS